MELHTVAIFKELVAKMNYLWFDLFKALGMEHRDLEIIRQQYPFNPNISLFEAISEWLKRGNASWVSLVQALRQNMLEAKLADGIAERHFSPQELEHYKSEKSLDQAVHLLDLAVY